MREQLIDTEGVPEDESWLIEDALILVGAESKAVLEILQKGPGRV